MLMHKIVDNQTAKPKGSLGSTLFSFNFLKRSSDSSVSSETHPPSASRGLSDTERQDPLEQAAQSRAQLEYITQQLNDSRQREDALHHQLSTALTAEEIARKEMQKALSELEDTRCDTK